MANLDNGLYSQGLDSLYEDTRDALFNYFFRRARDTETANDLLQETFTRFIAAGYDSQSFEEPKAILYKIGHNLLIDRLRKKKRRGSTENLDNVEVLHDRSPSPEQTAADRQDLELVSVAIRALKPVCRDVFLAHRVDGLKHKEIACKFGISVSMVEKHIAEAIFQLARALRESRR